MKIGLSTYSLLKAIKAGEMDVLDVVQWIADNGGKHMEIVPYGFTLVDNLELADAVRDKAKEVGIELSNYSMPANFVQETEEEFEQEVARIKEHVDLLHRMGIKHMRHDVTAFTLPPEKITIEWFEKNLHLMVEGSRQIADYAAQYGITTTIENHGQCVQHSDRVQRVLLEVDRPNFKTTLDIGNFLCVDEDPIVGVKKNLPFASLVHFKDFYIRPFDEHPGGGEWFTSANGNYLRGSIVGQGDVNIRQIVKLIKDSGYDGNITLEFEGMEECREASKIGMENIRRLWDEA
ncbi:sugar phosphate isomerase/epimerase family protein [Lederbergia galactosidilytica]|uniref:Sugar phosphate isomerase n=1 Tax=Lederbergia galactosidilytica TaxID=217031 RepID=A0A178A0V2_9BACI|nr:sugar phosphate isomerase/epimerase [Lederbergia galactosidilytica]KRG15452.1 sugar phosphate isomerase [Virgibacillus soli]MBP1916238.1 sugar phosphate isomerase/epimerase [Lederbergia galactosidilytica]OAK73805.1 sugar phosphate isomerase [Lederbergia galactosidilytica]